MNFTRAERRCERAKAASRIDPACPKDLRRDIDVALAGSLAGRSVEPGETLRKIVDRLCPEIYETVRKNGFVLSFELPENTHAALLRGIINYSIRRAPLN